MKGINFIEPLFHRVISGEKTQTRRIVKPQPVDRITKENQILYKPRYKSGETLYIKEPYLFGKHGIIYRYGNPEHGIEKGWYDKSMPAKYARHFIEITGVRCERLQDISDEDCLKEGIEKQIWMDAPFVRNFYVLPDMTCELYNDPREAYAALVNSIYGNGTWESNPFIWVYDFRLTAK